MEANEEKISLVNLKEGAAIEMFDRAMQAVLENINDINTTLKPREVNLGSITGLLKK